MKEHHISSKLKRKLKDWHNSVPPEENLGIEMLEILYSYYLLQGASLEEGSDNALDNLRRVRFVQLLINDIILRLCKFRDDSSMSLSFIQVTKALRKRVVKKERVDGIEAEIRKYNLLTQNLENHRNTYIAHLSKRARTHLKPTVEISDAVTLALQITDRLCGRKNSYKVLDIDLRQVLSSETAR